MGKSKIIYFLESIAAFGLKVHFLTLVKGPSDFNVKTCFSQKQLGDLEPKFI